MAGAVRAAIPLDPGMRVLEYGAGTGLLSQELAGEVGPLWLADSSQGMLDVLRSKVAAGTFSEATVWDLDLTRDPVPDERFDLVLALLVLHHVPDAARVLEAFAQLLVAGGMVCVIDLEKEDGTFHGEDFEGHTGFDRGELAGWLREAGFGETRFEVCYELVRDGRPYDLFLATSRLQPL